MQVARGAKKKTVIASSGVRFNARDSAYNKLGLPYNSNFAFNKTVRDSKYNCSQLVWASYMNAGNLNLDGNGGPGVYPTNIRDSPYTTTYATL